MNRSKKVVLGAGISFIFSLLQIVLSLLRTRIIIGGYGTDINSLNAVSSQLFNYVTLLEGGIGAGFLYTMYAPMAQKNYYEVNKLYNGLKRSIRRMAWIMLAATIVISFVYPLVVAKNSLGYLRIVWIFLLMSVRYIIPYFFSVYNKQLLILSEKQHFLSLIDGFISVGIIVMEIVLIGVFQLPFEAVLLMGIVFTILTAFTYRLCVLKTCNPLIGKTSEYSLAGRKMTKDIMVHKVAYIANTQIDGVLLSFLDLFKTTVYTAYNSIVSYPAMIMNKVIVNLRGALGVKMNSGDSKEQNYSLFKEMLTMNIFIAIVVCSVFLLMINKFVTLWLGEKFLLGGICLVLMMFNLFHTFVNEIIILFRDAKGLYKDSKWYTLATAISNLVLSVILMQFWGITGLLIATVFSTYCIMDLGNNILLFKKAFKQKLSIYLDYLLAFCTIALNVFLGYLLQKYLFNGIESYNFLWFVLETIVIAAVSVVVTVCLQLIFNRYFKKLVNRLLGLFRRKKN